MNFGCAKTHRIIEIDALRDPLGEQLSDVQKHIVLLKSTRSGIDIYEVCLSQTLFFPGETPNSLNTYDTLGDTFASRSSASDLFFVKNGHLSVLCC